MKQTPKNVEFKKLKQQKQEAEKNKCCNSNETFSKKKRNKLNANVKNLNIDEINKS